MVEADLPAAPLEVEGGGGVPGEEGVHPVGMVPVGVGEDAEGHSPQVQPQSFGVSGEEIAGPGVQQEGMALVLQV